MASPEDAALIAAAPELLASLRAANRDGHASDCFCAVCEDRRAILARLEKP